jgi:hypothetical protein
MASPGDTVFVRQGDYSSEGVITLSSSGSPSGMITYKSEPRRTAIVAGFNVNAEYNRIEGFDIDSNYNPDYNGEDSFRLRRDNVEIVDNYIHNSFHRGIDTFTMVDNIYVADNYLYNVGAGININGNNWIVERNEIQRLHRHPGSGWDADYSRFFGTNHIIRNNYFHGTISSEIGVSHTDCFQSYSSNNGYAHHILFEGNRCFGYFSQGIIANDMTTNSVLTHLIIRNNIFANDPAERGSWGVLGTSLKHTTVVNNVFSNIRYFGVGLRVASDNCTVRNNIFYNMPGNSVYFSEGAGFDGDYNIIHGGGTAPVLGPNDLTDTDPLFVDVGNFDFELDANSPAIDSGSPVMAPGSDIRGITRPQGLGFDRGAYEY